MEVQAVKDKIIVMVLNPKSETKTKGGLFLPESHPQGYGKILSIGEEVFSKNENNKFEKGQVILFAKQAGMDFVIKDMICKVVKDEEIYGILDEEDYQIEDIKNLILT